MYKYVISTLFKNKSNENNSLYYYDCVYCLWRRASIEDNIPVKYEEKTFIDDLDDAKVTVSRIMKSDPSIEKIQIHRMKFLYSATSFKTIKRKK